MGHHAHTVGLGEYELVRQLVSAQPSGEAASVLAAASDAVDWSKVALLATYHRVLPTLWAHVEQSGREHVPLPILQYLHSQSVEGAIRVLFLSSEMAEIARELKKEEVPFLVLKGPSLSDAYGGIAQRPFVDNDILVRRDDFSRLEDVLLDMGFEQSKRGPNQLRGYLFIHGEYTFGRRVGTQRSTVDAHTNVAPRGYSYNGSYETLIHRSRAIKVGGEEVNALGWEDLFLALCVNALKDQWNRLRLANDIARVSYKVADWDLLGRLAKEMRCVRAFHIGILVATDEVGASFPDTVIQDARSDLKASFLSKYVRRHLRTFHEEQVMSGGDRARLVLQAQDDVQGQLRYLGYVALRRITERLVDPHEPGTNGA